MFDSNKMKWQNNDYKNFIMSLITAKEMNLEELENEYKIYTSLAKTTESKMLDVETYRNSKYFLIPNMSQQANFYFVISYYCLYN